MSKPKFSWSYSVVNAFNTCPRQFYHVRVMKEYPFEQNEAARYGQRMHEAIERYGRDGKPLPQEFQFVKPTVDIVKEIAGEKYWEKKISVDKNFQPRDYFSKDTWFRAQIDFMSVNPRTRTARVIDWKSGASRYADTAQLELMALAIFKLHPDIDIVRGGLSFLTEDRFIPAEYRADKQGEYWVRWDNELEQIEHAYDSGVWNAKPSGLCRKHCPVLSCEHNGRS